MKLQVLMEQWNCRSKFSQPSRKLTRAAVESTRIRLCVHWAWSVSQADSISCGFA